MRRKQVSYSKDGKTYTALDGTTVLTYEGVQAKEAARAKEAAKGNARFVEGSEALKWKTVPLSFHFPPMVGKVQLDRETNVRKRALHFGSNWVK
jgi:hypothetical protein